ncbi:MAG: hypothetical protein GOMPHAMPRED_001977 [Gomphillus americanus]|uniref:Uncharacterized protein n=1 Tax=Gomphillus americanus TaxID=1940652 RepID=A0A8H3FAM6_9LECA|nr:MAG: hypothetical protein GOMPHAMPRED_001977 [Gomphillus americanus]
MSSSSAPISAERFTLAVADLPLANVYAKAAEIRNSIAHLQNSNHQLQPDADGGDRDCAEAIAENIGVIGRMQERLNLLKNEVERRGYNWDEGRPNGVNGDAMDLDEDMSPAQHSNAGSSNMVGLQEHQPTSTAAGSGPRSNPSEADLLASLVSRLQESDEHGLHL